MAVCATIRACAAAPTPHSAAPVVAVRADAARALGVFADRRTAPAVIGATAAALLALFVAWPLLLVLARGATHWAELAGGAWLGVLARSLAVAAVSTAVAVALGSGLAYAVTRADVPGKRLVAIACRLPAVLPPFFAALALLLLFGDGGLVVRAFGWRAGIAGFGGVVVAQTVAFLPDAFLVMVHTFRRTGRERPRAPLPVRRNRLGVDRQTVGNPPATLAHALPRARGGGRDVTDRRQPRARPPRGGRRRRAGDGDRPARHQAPRGRRDADRKVGAAPRGAAGHRARGRLPARLRGRGRAARRCDLDPGREHRVRQAPTSRVRRDRARAESSAGARGGRPKPRRRTSPHLRSGDAAVPAPRGGGDLRRALHRRGRHRERARLARSRRLRAALGGKPRTRAAGRPRARVRARHRPRSPLPLRGGAVPPGGRPVGRVRRRRRTRSRVRARTPTARGPAETPARPGGQA